MCGEWNKFGDWKRIFKLCLDIWDSDFDGSWEDVFDVWIYEEDNNGVVVVKGWGRNSVCKIVYDDEEMEDVEEEVLIGIIGKWVLVKIVKVVVKKVLMKKLLFCSCGWKVILESEEEEEEEEEEDIIMELEEEFEFVLKLVFVLRLWKVVVLVWVVLMKKMIVVKIISIWGKVVSVMGLKIW